MHGTNDITQCINITFRHHTAACGHLLVKAKFHPYACRYRLLCHLLQPAKCCYREIDFIKVIGDFEPVVLFGQCV
jgi:hypothetical protein